MTLKEKLSDDMKAAMRAKESEKLATIRLINAAIKQREVDERIELGDDQVLSVIEKMIKQRKDSITQCPATSATHVVSCQHLVGHSSETAGDKPEEGVDDVKSSCPLHPGLHTYYNATDKGQQTRES